MQFFRCPSSICGRPFQVNRFDAQLAVPAQLGKITCPHCGLLVYGDSQSLFLTHALSAAQEYEFNLRNAALAAHA
jgi:hypothetical protein